MREVAAPFTMHDMTRPNASSKLWLIPEPRPSASRPDGALVRRYRIARLRLDATPSSADRFPQLSRVYD